MSVFQPRTQLFFSLRSKRPFWSEVERFSASNLQQFFFSEVEEAVFERFFSLEPAAVFFSLRSKRPFWSEVERFSASNLQLFFSLRSKRPFWSEVERFFSLEPAAVFFFSEVEEAVLERS